MEPSTARLLAGERQSQLRSDAGEPASAGGFPRSRTGAPRRSSRARHEPRSGDRFDPVTEAILRGGVALGLVGIALVHFLDLFSKLEETPYLGVAYLGLIAASLAVAGRLIHGSGRGLWLLAGALAAATVTGYVLSRAVGLPQASGDIGNWQEPLGLAALFVEGLVLVLSVYALAPPRRRANP